MTLGRREDRSEGEKGNIGGKDCKGRKKNRRGEETRRGRGKE